MGTGFTLEEAQRRYRDYLAAEESVLLGQEYTLATGEKLIRADLKKIQEGLKYWEMKCNEFSEEDGEIGFYQTSIK